MKKKINELFEEPKIEEGKDFIDMQHKWKDAMRQILDRVGINSPYSNSMDIYSELIRAHKKIFGDEKHDSNWMGFGMGPSRAQLDTYLLIRIHGTLKCLMERGTDLEESFYQNENEIIETNQEKEIAKEDFKEIDMSELPDEFRKQIKEKYVKKCFVNSDGIYRVKIHK
ncbi:MAG: hypothetical protein KAT28_02125 [Candidatus Aenigmarchaeota archaeon]|nr:hypothetical protein [Candidatus Aenigmarchaeota archaeon]